MIIKAEDELRSLVMRILLAAGANDQNAECVAQHLVRSNLSGVDTHGVWHVRSYVKFVQEGQIVATAAPEIRRQAATSALVSGHWGFGHLTARFGMELAITKAQAADIGLVSLVEVHHIGRLGHYVEMAAAEGLIGMVWGGGYSRQEPRAVPYGGRQGLLDTNPMAFAAPSGGDWPVLFDFATTSLSGVKVVNAKRRNQPVPPGAIVDRQGNQTTDPNAFHAFAPFGGHKGYALMMAGEFLGRILSGSDRYVRADQKEGGPMFSHQGVLMLVFRADLFQLLADFTAQARELTAQTRATAPAPGFDRVLVPGDPEAAARSVRRREGIPIDEDIWQEIEKTASELDVPI